MKMKNIEIELFASFLKNMPIKSGKASRMRTRLVKQLEQRRVLIESERRELIEKHAVKDPEGNPIYTVVNEQENHIQYEVAHQELLNLEMAELFNEEFVIEETESAKDMLITVRDAILDYEGDDLQGEKANLYDRFCEIIENIYQ